jgi:hypothetical protein
MKVIVSVIANVRGHFYVDSKYTDIAVVVPVTVRREPVGRFARRYRVVLSGPARVGPDKNGHGFTAVDSM